MQCNQNKDDNIHKSQSQNSWIDGQNRCSVILKEKDNKNIYSHY